MEGAGRGSSAGRSRRRKDELRKGRVKIVDESEGDNPENDFLSSLLILLRCEGGENVTRRNLSPMQGTGQATKVINPDKTKRNEQNGK